MQIKTYEEQRKQTQIFTKCSYKLFSLIIREPTLKQRGGIQVCCKDDKFWINFYAWKDAKYGARGPTQMDWDIIMAEEE